MLERVDRAANADVVVDGVDDGADVLAELEIEVFEVDDCRSDMLIVTNSVDIEGRCSSSEDSIFPISSESDSLLGEGSEVTVCTRVSVKMEASSV